MNNQPNDGGPAFPTPDVYHPNNEVEYGQPGMSLRDWFAGQALAGLCADSNLGGKAALFAGFSYELADAMLAARNRKP